MAKSAVYSELFGKVSNGETIDLDIIPRKHRASFVNQKTASGGTILHTAVFEENPSNVRVLVEAGADVNAENDSKNTPLLYASNADIVDILVQKGAYIDAKNSMGYRLLDNVILFKNIDLLKHLLEKKLVKPKYAEKHLNIKGMTTLEGIHHTLYMQESDYTEYYYVSD